MSRPVEFLYDYASPYAYVASETLAERLPGLRVERVPVYIRGLEMFSGGVPFSVAKSRYIVEDVRRVAAHHGVALKMPPVFPINGLHALRGALIAAEVGRLDTYHRAAFRAAWAEARDVGDRDVVVAVAEEAGLDAGRFAERLGAPDVKARLRASTENAVARGVFGLPSFFVDGELFWGHDRMDYVLRAAER